MIEELKALAQSLQAAKDYADLIVKPPLEEFGGMLADTVGHWRLKNRVNCLLKAKQYCESQGIIVEKLLPSVFVPLIEEAGNADDERLSDMFARLTTTHLDPKRQDQVHPAYAKVLGQLAPLDAKVLEILDELEHAAWQELYKTKDFDKWADWSIHRDDIVTIVKQRFGKISASHVNLSFENLERLGITEHEPTPPISFEHPVSKDERHDGVRTSPFGRRLIKAVSAPDHWRITPRDIDEELYQILYGGASN